MQIFDPFESSATWFRSINTNPWGNKTAPVFGNPRRALPSQICRWFTGGAGQQLMCHPERKSWPDSEWSSVWGKDTPPCWGDTAGGAGAVLVLTVFTVSHWSWFFTSTLGRRLPTSPERRSASLLYRLTTCDPTVDTLLPPVHIRREGSRLTICFVFVLFCFL